MRITFGTEAAESEESTIEQFLGYTIRLTLEGWQPMDIRPIEIWHDSEGFATLRFEHLDSEQKKVGTGNVLIHEAHEFHVY